MAYRRAGLCNAKFYFLDRVAVTQLSLLIAFSIALLCPCIALAEEPVSALLQRDAAYGHGQVEFVGREVLSVSRPYEQRERLVFREDGRVLDWIEHPQNVGPAVTRVAFVRTPDWRYTETIKYGGSSVVFDSTEERWQRAENPLFFVTEAPCLPLGLGLSRMTHLQVEGQVVSGELPSGDRLAYVLRGGAVSEVKRFREGRVASVWRLEGRLNTGTGLLLPEVAKIYLSDNALDPPVREYRILSADLAKVPKDEDLITNWFQPHARIIDRRVTPEVQWTYEEFRKVAGKATLTPEELLKLSQQQAGFAPGSKATAAVENPDGRDVQISSAEALFLATLVGVIALLALGTLVRTHRFSG